MCGIIGFNWKDKTFLKKGLSKIAHRGPDASGLFIDDNMSLGHARLAILDLTDSGNQPMCNERKDIWVVFNGEIYNYKELKEKLKKKHVFKSNTDTEVLIHLYEEEGKNFVKHLQGMFAFCIYDKRKKSILLGRDRVGIKPLYYYDNGNKFLFCSEIKGMLQYTNLKREVNLNALEPFLLFRANVEEETFFKGIKKLKPGNILDYNLVTKKAKIEKFWDLNFEPQQRQDYPYEKKIVELLEDSVRMRLMSDVPYGAFLSGGVDSGIIVQLMKKYSKENIKTFSVGFDNKKYSELEEARFIANKLGTNHRELVLNEKCIASLPEIIYHSDEPLADPTAIPIYYLSKYVKKHSTVILTGEGADEIFGGYPQYKFMKIHANLIQKLPQKQRELIPKIIKLTPNFVRDKAFRFSSALGEKGMERFSKFINSNDDGKKYMEQIAIFDEEEMCSILLNHPKFYESYVKFFENSIPENIVNKCGEFDFKGVMVEDLLMKIDKNTMAFSVEGRVPYLDHRLVELAATIPDKLKLSPLFKDKYILRKSFRDFLPRETTERRKRHFFVPINEWLEQYLSKIRGVLLSEKYIKKQRIFNYSHIEKMNEGFLNSKLYYARQIWCLLTFQIWYKQYMENEKVVI